MRILVVNNYFPEHVGGIEFVAQHLVHAYRQRGHQVRWLAGEVPAGSHQGPADDIPLRVNNFTERRLDFPYPLPGPGAWARLKAQTAWCDVVHLHDCLYAANLLAFRLAHRRRVPVLVTQHVAAVPYAQAYKRALQALAYHTLGRYVLARADQVVFISRVVADWFATRIDFRRPPLFAPNGVDKTLFYPAAPAERAALRARLGLPLDRPVLLFVGRLVAKKGVHLLRGIAADRPDWHWLFVGRAGNVDPAGWGAANVDLRASVSQAALRDYYAAADMLLLPAQGEGFPSAVQQAMACGTPALITPETAAALADGAAPFILAEPTTAAIAAALADWLPAPGSPLAPGRLAAQRPVVAAYAARRWRWADTVDVYEACLAALAAGRESVA